MAAQGRQQGRLDEPKQHCMWQNARTLVGEWADHRDVRHGADRRHDTTASMLPPPEHFAVACVPARADSDEIAATIVGQIMERRGVGAKTLSCSTLTVECMDELRALQVNVVCVCTVFPPAWRHSRYLC